MGLYKYMHNAASYLRLARWHLPLAGAALTAVLVVRVMLWLVPYRLVLRMVKPGHENLEHAGFGDLHWCHQAAMAVEVAARLVPKASCLTQALATLIVLKIHGESAKLVYGVRHDSRGHLQAHAWLETREGVLIGQTSDLSTFQPMGNMEVRA